MDVLLLYKIELLLWSSDELLHVAYVYVPPPPSLLPPSTSCSQASGGADRCLTVQSPPVVSRPNGEALVSSPPSITGFLLGSANTTSKSLSAALWDLAPADSLVKNVWAGWGRCVLEEGEK